MWPEFFCITANILNKAQLKKKNKKQFQPTCYFLDSLTTVLFQQLHKGRVSNRNGKRISNCVLLKIPLFRTKKKLARLQCRIGVSWHFSMCPRLVKLRTSTRGRFPKYNRFCTYDSLPYSC